MRTDLQQTIADGMHTVASTAQDAADHPFVQQGAESLDRFGKFLLDTAPEPSELADNIVEFTAVGGAVGISLIRKTARLAVAHPLLAVGITMATLGAFALWRRRNRPAAVEANTRVTGMSSNGQPEYAEPVLVPV